MGFEDVPRCQHVKVNGVQCAASGCAASQLRDVRELAWAADGSLFPSDEARLWHMATDGKNATQLLAHPNALMMYPPPERFFQAAC